MSNETRLYTGPGADVGVFGAPPWFANSTSGEAGTYGLRFSPALEASICRCGRELRSLTWSICTDVNFREVPLELLRATDYRLGFKRCSGDAYRPDDRTAGFSMAQAQSDTPYYAPVPSPYGFLPDGAFGLLHAAANERDGATFGAVSPVLELTANAEETGGDVAMIMDDQPPQGQQSSSFGGCEGAGFGAQGDGRFELGAVAYGQGLGGATAFDFSGATQQPPFAFPCQGPWYQSMLPCPQGIWSADPTQCPNWTPQCDVVAPHIAEIFPGEAGEAWRIQQRVEALGRVGHERRSDGVPSTVYNAPLLQYVPAAQPQECISQEQMWNVPQIAAPSERPISQDVRDAAEDLKRGSITEEQEAEDDPYAPREAGRMEVSHTQYE